MQHDYFHMLGPKAQELHDGELFTLLNTELFVNKIVKNVNTSSLFVLLSRQYEPFL